MQAVTGIGVGKGVPVGGVDALGGKRPASLRQRTCSTSMKLPVVRSSATDSR